MQPPQLQQPASVHVIVVVVVIVIVVIIIVVVVIVVVVDVDGVGKDEDRVQHGRYQTRNSCVGDISFDIWSRPGNTDSISVFPYFCSTASNLLPLPVDLISRANGRKRPPM